MPGLLIEVVAIDPDGGGEFGCLDSPLEPGLWLLGRFNILPEEFLELGVELVELAAHHPQMIPVVLCPGRWRVTVEGHEGDTSLLQGVGELPFIEQGCDVLDHLRAGLLGVEVGFLLCHYQEDL